MTKRKYNTNNTMPYFDLINLFNQVIQNIATIEEIDVLIKQNAEVKPTILADNTYVSFEHLNIWRKSYISKLITRYCYLKDVFNIFKYSLPKDTFDILSKEMNKIEQFVQQEV